MSVAPVTVQQLGIMRHALGHLKYERNHFVTGSGSSNWEPLQGLVANGFMVSRGKHPLAESDETFYVTLAGCRAAFDMEGLSTAQEKVVRKLFPPERRS